MWTMRTNQTNLSIVLWLIEKLCAGTLLTGESSNAGWCARNQIDTICAHHFIVSLFEYYLKYAAVVQCLWIHEMSFRCSIIFWRWNNQFNFLWKTFPSSSDQNVVTAVTFEFWYPIVIWSDFLLKLNGIWICVMFLIFNSRGANEMSMNET